MPTIIKNGKMVEVDDEEFSKRRPRTSGNTHRYVPIEEKLSSDSSRHQGTQVLWTVILLVGLTVLLVVVGQLLKGW
jgi:hypothetical protein